MQKILKAPATISKVESMADNTIRLRCDLQEIPSELSGEIMNLRNKLGWFAFSETPVADSEFTNLPELREFENQKSLSERLRNVLWVYHQKNGGTAETFESFRSKIMERTIQGWKDRIQELESNYEENL